MFDAKKIKLNADAILTMLDACGAAYTQERMNNDKGLRIDLKISLFDDVITINAYDTGKVWVQGRGPEKVALVNAVLAFLMLAGGRVRK